MRAVTFDFWSTLVRDDPQIMELRLSAWKQILDGTGHPMSVEQIKDAFGKAWVAYVEAWQANVPFGAAHALEIMVSHLGVAPDATVTSALLQVITDPPENRHPMLNENVLECLDTLKSGGVKLGIICDVGLTPSRVLRRYLDQQGALAYFDHWSFSDEVGVFKPDEKIFHHALDGLGGIAPDAAAHVGDLRRTDVVGAKAMGMTAIRYSGANDDPPAEDGPLIEGDFVVTDHAEIPKLLDLA